MFTQEELIEFKDTMLDMCSKLNVYVDPKFEKMALSSVCVKNTMRNHGCNNLKQLIYTFEVWFIENPDSDGYKHWLKCRTNSFFGDTGAEELF